MPDFTYTIYRRLKSALCHLMFSYLKGRRRRVKISNSRSFWTLLTKCAPQGSILGPFLLNVFMNDLFLFIQNCFITMLMTTRWYTFRQTLTLFWQTLSTTVKCRLNGSATTAWRQILTNFNSWCCHLTLWKSKGLKLKTTKHFYLNPAPNSLAW